YIATRSCVSFATFENLPDLCGDLCCGLTFVNGDKDRVIAGDRSRDTADMDFVYEQRCRRGQTDAASHNYEVVAGQCHRIPAETSDGRMFRFNRVNAVRFSDADLLQVARDAGLCNV